MGWYVNWKFRKWFVTGFVQSESVHHYSLNTYWMTFSVYSTSLLDTGEGRMLSSSQPIWTSLDQIWPVKCHLSIQLNCNNNSSWHSIIAYIIKSLTISTIYMHRNKYLCAYILVLFYTWVFDAYIYPKLFLHSCYVTEYVNQWKEWRER